MGDTVVKRNHATKEKVWRDKQHQQLHRHHYQQYGSVFEVRLNLSPLVLHLRLRVGGLMWSIFHFADDDAIIIRCLKR